jgi:hypothetical protein
MTPYRTDIDTNSFRPVTNGYVKVANDQHEPIIGIGNVTILIKCYSTGMNITWTLFNVVVVPTIVRRLIATDELNDAGHSIGMEPSGIVLTLREHPNVPTQRKVTVLKYPRTWQYDSDAKEYQWPAAEYQFAEGTAPQGFLISPISLNLRQETVASANAVEDKTDNAPPDDDNSGSDDDHTSDEDSNDGTDDSPAEETQATKRAVHLQTIHNRLGHRSVESLLLGNRDNIWNDVKVQRDPESICQTCQITLARKTARNKKTAADFPSEPGRMVTIDIIQNPFPTGLTKKSYFGYYLLIVDVYSTMPVLFGLKSLTAHSIIRTLKMYLATIKPKINEPRPPGEINGHHLQHIRADAGAQFTSAEFIQACHDEGINISLAAPKHQEMNGICERTWQSLRNLAFSSMNYAVLAKSSAAWHSKMHGKYFPSYRLRASARNAMSPHHTNCFTASSRPSESFAQCFVLASTKCTSGPRRFLRKRSATLIPKPIRNAASLAYFAVSRAAKPDTSFGNLVPRRLSSQLTFNLMKSSIVWDRANILHLRTRCP